MAKYGTAPHREGGKWVTQKGRVLTPAGQRQWTEYLKEGRFDLSGHRVRSATAASSAGQVDRPLATTQQQIREASQRRAYQLASQTWDVARREIGPGLPDRNRSTMRPMPNVYFGSRSPGRHPTLDLEAEAAVPRAAAWPAGYHGLGQSGHPIRDNQAGTVVMQDWALPPRGSDPHVTQYWLDVLTHEMAHTQQSPRLLQAPNRRLRMEGGADAFARLMRNRMGEQLDLPVSDHRYWGYDAPYFPLSSKFLKQYGREYALRGQFQRG